MNTAEVVICGAGIAGIAAAYHLAARQGVRHVLLVDERPPLSLTSDKSTEAYRNWWPGPDAAMRGLMNRSIDLLEELARASDNRIQLNRRGYVYATADPFRAAALEADVLAAPPELGPLRVHDWLGEGAPYLPAEAEGFRGKAKGLDLIHDPALIRRYFPYLNEQTMTLFHARRCGWFSGQQLGMLLLEEARHAGATLLAGRVTGVKRAGGRVTGVVVRTDGQERVVATDVFVNAAGPFVNHVAALLDVSLPVFSERHLKVSIKDTLGVVPRDAPLLIWEDPQQLPWSEEERAWLAESTETAWLLERFPGGVHCRPEGGADSQNLLLLWAYHAEPVEPVLPLPADDLFPELVLRGMATMIPGLSAYFDPLPRPHVDGGYYTKTRENRPLIGSLPVDGAFILGALSGYGLMAATGAGELLAAHVTGGALPPYAPAFELQRYEDPAYLRQIEGWRGSAQL